MFVSFKSQTHTLRQLILWSMLVLANLLASTHVSSLIKSKGSKKTQLITLRSDATIRTALMTFVENDISAIPIQDGSDTEFLGMLNIVDILRYILKGSPESFYKQDVKTLLNRPLSVIIKECGIRRVKIIRDQLSLMQLLFEHWGQKIPIEDQQIDIKHLLVNCGHGKYSVVTPTDLLRYVLLMSKECGYLHNTKACVVESCYQLKDHDITSGDEDAWMAFKQLLQNTQFHVLGIVDPETGKLEASLSATDFLPLSLKPKSLISSAAKATFLEEAISLLRRPGLSLYTFVRTTHPVCCETDIGPICLQPHFSLADLIEKMAKMEIHHLWLVSQDRTRTPVGIVGVCDVIAHFCKIFEPFYKQAASQ